MIFTKQDTYEKIRNTPPVDRAIGNLFPTCWSERIPPSLFSHTMEQIESEVTMEWGAPFLSDAFVECANILMDAANNNRYQFISLWEPKEPDWIPDADLNRADSVWLFTENLTKQAKSPRPAAILCPGGGYEMISAYSEGIQLAQRMERDGGYKAFILNYRITPNFYPLPQMDLALAILHLRAHANLYQIDPNRIVVVGASAGGHLCASEAYLHSQLKQEILAELSKKGNANDYEGCSARPDAVGLLYPVISFTSEYHEGSYLALTKGQADLRESLSVETHIKKDYPPTYAFANKDDDAVPSSNTKRLEYALQNAGIPHLCDIFPTGGHGVGLGYDCSCKSWSERMLDFFAKECAPG